MAKSVTKICNLGMHSVTPSEMEWYALTHLFNAEQLVLQCIIIPHLD